MRVNSSVASIFSAPALWVSLAATGLPAGLALALYWMSAAPGLTWAHHGADGGDLLAAAMTNGVPHPSGYPLYTLLLRGWLWWGHALNPHLEIAYWGNRLSALCVAGAVAFTAATAAALLREYRLRRLWAVFAALAFALSPLAWSQALITEVYGLHALLLAAMGWAVLPAEDRRGRGWDAIIGLLMALGAAHHLTSLLFWPALLYWRLRAQPRHLWLWMVTRMVGVALLVALLFYLGIIWRVANVPLPIAWGYPRDLEGLWWLISGAAYRAYLFGMTPPEYAGRLASLARILVEQFTPVGLALVITGFAVWDRRRPFLRNGALLWMLPISLYAAGYNTIDSYIYLLPVVWLMALLVGQGLASSSEWLAHHFKPAPWLLTTLAVLALVLLTAWRLPQLDLRDERAAQEYLAAAAATLEPGSLVISSADAPTFALWYGQWGSGELANKVPNLVLVNYALYQFGWYRDLMHDLYREVPMVDTSIAELIAANRSQRPIYLTEPLPELSPAEMTPIGDFWRLTSP